MQQTVKLSNGVIIQLPEGVTAEVVTLGGVAHGPTLSPSYFTSADLKKAVATVRPLRRVTCDAQQIDGSGVELPALQFGTAPNGSNVNAMDGNDPYWKTVGLSEEHVARMAEAAPVLKAALAAPDPEKLKAWESGPATTAPQVMQLLIYLIGPGGANSKKEVDAYATYFYKRYGNTGQYGSTILPDAEYKAIIAR